MDFAAKIKDMSHILMPVLIMSNSSTFMKLAMTFLPILIEVISYFITTNVAPLFNRQNLSYKIKVRSQLTDSGLYSNTSRCKHFIGFMSYITESINKIDITNLQIIQDLDIGYNGIDFIYISKNQDLITHINEKFGFVIKSNTSEQINANSKMIKTTIIEVEIIVKTNKLIDLCDFLDKIRDEYNKLFCIDSKKYLYIHRIKEINTTHSLITTHERKFTSTKTFDNMFFEGKKQLISILKNFAEKKETYLKLGLPYTLGFLLHGEPGCGKTSVIKCIARYMSRNILIVDTSIIKTRDELEIVLLYEKEKTIFVFEEIDCGAWKDIVIDRSLITASTSHESGANMEMMKLFMENMSGAAAGATADKKESPPIPKKALTLSDILEILDGIVDMDGRVIIFTTNHKEILDPAILRPGRIDHILEFTKMSKRCIREMYKQWFDEDIPDKIYEEMCDNVFSQAEVGNIFKSFDREKRLEALRSKGVVRTQY